MNLKKKGLQQHKDGRKAIDLDSIKFPRSLRSREGWSKYLDSQTTSEPFIHQIEPTNHCKYTCIMCPRSEYMTRSVGLMEFDLFTKIINEISGFSSQIKEREIELFHFGESLLHPRLPEMVGYAADHDLKIALSVNGQDLTPECATDMLQNGVHRIIISLDGYDEESMKQIRGKRANYKAAVENLESLISIRKETRSEVNIEVRMIRMNFNDSHAEEFVNRWSGKGVNVVIRAFFPWSVSQLGDLGEFEKYAPGLPCPFPWEYMVVQWNGDVVGCCRDYNAENVLGNVRKNSLKEIWNGSKLHKLRHQLRTGDYQDNHFCRKCMSLYYTEPESQSSDRPSQLSQTTIKRTHSEFLPIRNENGDVWNTLELLQDSIEKTRKAKDAQLKREILYWSAHCSNATEIKGKLDLEYEQLSEFIKDLVQDGYLISADEMVTGASSSEGSVFYPHYDLNSIWEIAVKSYGNHVYITDENHGDLLFGEADNIKQMVSSRLLSAGVGKGDRVVLYSAVNSEALILFWAIVGLGAIFVSIDHDLPAGRVGNFISELTPKLIFVDRERAKFMKDWQNTVVFDDINASLDDSFLSFARWLEGSENTATNFSKNSENLMNENAAIILTSGTSSQSKAVCLSHGTLTHSAHLLACSFSISSHDRLFILGDLHTISGLRNSVIVPAVWVAELSLPTKTPVNLRNL